MDKSFGSIVSVLVVIGIYIALGAVMISGWVCWAKRTEPRTLSSILSLVGFVLASASALLAISTALYARAIGGFPYYDPLLLRIYRVAALLSIGATVFAIGGAWRPNLLRWYAPACAIGMLTLWFMWATYE